LQFSNDLIKNKTIYKNIYDDPFFKEAITNQTVTSVVISGKKHNIPKNNTNIFKVFPLHIEFKPLENSMPIRLVNGISAHCGSCNQHYFMKYFKNGAKCKFCFEKELRSIRK
jgi:hypothetical protein